MQKQKYRGKCLIGVKINCSKRHIAKNGLYLFLRNLPLRLFFGLRSKMARNTTFDLKYFESSGFSIRLLTHKKK